MHAGEHF